MPDDPVPALLARAAEALAREFAGLPPLRAGSAEADDPMPMAMAAVLEETAHRLGDNYPYFHPLYAGQMLKPPHPVARAAYALAMTINPNNHARDGGRASSAMEIEAVAEIAADVRLEGQTTWAISPRAGRWRISKRCGWRDRLPRARRGTLRRILARSRPTTRTAGSQQS